MALTGYQPNQPAFSWRATGDISAEVFSMNKRGICRRLESVCHTRYCIRTANSIESRIQRYTIARRLEFSVANDLGKIQMQVG